MRPDVFLAMSGGLPEPMALVSLDGSILAANGAASGFSIASILTGQDLLELLRPTEAVQSWLAACRASRTLRRAVFTMQSGDGRSVDVRCEGVGVGTTDGEPAHEIPLP